MPCSMGSAPTAADYNSSNISDLRNDVAELRRDQKKMKAEGDSATQLLCYLCGVVEYASPQIWEKVDPRMKIWWDKHQEWDENRVAKAIQLLKGFLLKEDMAEYMKRAAEGEHPLSKYHQIWLKQMVEKHY